jgi:oligopeptide/dipeptide ABC transporter ATP-binding protein
VSQALLQVTGLEVDYPTASGVVHAVNGVDLEVSRGEIVGLVGESGCGKSSTALAILNLVRSPGRVSGSVRFAGRELLQLGDEELRELRGRKLSMIVQNPRGALNPMLRIGVQIVNVVQAHTPMKREAARTHAIDMLRLLGINDPVRRFDAYPHELSGGMAQRALIAMALACAPEILIADEPTSGLDVTVQAQILDDLARGVRETGASVLVVSQNLGLVANYCDRVLVMYAGQIVESASAIEFFEHPGHPSSRALLSLYLEDAAVRLHDAVTDLHRLPSGCLAHPRCPWNDGAACEHDRQALRPVRPGHSVRCHRWEEIHTQSVPAAAPPRAAQT